MSRAESSEPSAEAEIMAEVLRQFRATVCRELADDLIAAAVRYARLRTDWQLATVEDRRRMDAERSRAHNALIDCCHVLCRNQERAGEHPGWFAYVGASREDVGDFACRLHCHLGLLAR